MPASDSRVSPRLPATYRTRVILFSFPLSFALLEDYLERQPPDRSELERAFGHQPVELIPVSPQPPLDGVDQWEMVIPKMAGPPRRAQRLGRARESANETPAADRGGVL